MRGHGPLGMKAASKNQKARSILSQSIQKEHSPDDTLILGLRGLDQTVGPQNCKIINSHCFKPLDLSYSNRKQIWLIQFSLQSPFPLFVRLNIFFYVTGVFVFFPLSHQRMSFPSFFIEFPPHLGFLIYYGDWPFVTCVAIFPHYLVFQSRR